MHTKESYANPILEGSITKQILLFFFPIVFGTFFQQLYNTADMIIVGRFVGTDALASVGGSAAQIINLVIGFFTGLSAGSGVIIAQAYGAGDKKRLSDNIHTAYAYAIVGGILFTIVGIFSAAPSLIAMHNPTELMTDSALYLRIYYGGILFVLIFNIGSAILRALGDSRRPLYALIVCCFLNIFLDIVFVVLFHLGIAGAALATVLSQLVSAVLVTVFLMRTPQAPLVLSRIRCHRRCLSAQLYVGIPDGFQTVMYSFANLIIQASINGYGTSAVAAWASEAKIEAFFWMVSGAYCVAATTFTGQNYGAGKYERIQKGTRICLLLHQGTCVMISLVFFIFARPLIMIFTSDPEVIRLGIQVLHLITPFYAVFSFVEILSSVLRGMNDVIIPMLLTLFGVCILRIIWTLGIVPLHPGIPMLCANYPITWITTSLLFIGYYLYRKRHGLYASASSNT